MATATYTKAGTKAATPAKLDKAVFGVAADNHELLKAAYTGYLANGRPNLAFTKTRGQVRGANKKPWKQKGTGRARAGSRYGPIWRGGGITFGPTGRENYSRQLNTGSKRLAVKQALSLKADQVIVIEDIVSKEGKTAELARLMVKIGASRNVLIIVDRKTAELTRAARNLPNVKVVSALYVNVYDVLNADCIVFNAQGLRTTTGWLAGRQSSKPSGGEAK